MVHRVAGRFLAFLNIMGVRMAEKVLSIFIDESGDFGPYEKHNPYYLVAMVAHDQCMDLSMEIEKMNHYIIQNGREIHAIHVGPLIRRESIYENELVEDRKHLFNLLYNFVRRVDIQYISCSIKKSECSDEVEMTSKLTKAMAGKLRDNDAFFRQFDRIIVYYDNGQVQLTKIITSLFNALFTDVEVRKVRPVNYKLFQVADLVCTMELLALKAEQNGLSNSELEFFGNVRSFKRDYLKNLRKKKME